MPHMPHMRRIPADALEKGVTPRMQDRLARGGIISAGVLCFCLLAWAHLGVGAYFFPPAPTVSQQVARTDGFAVTLALSSGQLTAAGPNTLAITIDDAHHRAITDARVQASLVMTTMAMDAPSVSATLGSHDHYIAHPRFAMAGIWRVTLAFMRPDGVTHIVVFTVSVRWG